MPSDKLQREIEETRLVHDYYKHLTTLSVASVLIIVAFLEKIFEQPEWRFLVVVSIVGFLLTILCSTISKTMNIFEFMLEGKEIGYFPLTVTGIGVFGTWLFFITAIASLTAFAIRNLV